MEWSSDGYALAVGWENGWALWSVSGRCLASGFGIEDEIDYDRCVHERRYVTITHRLRRFKDTFMFGITELVSIPRIYKTP
jgi:hypothetical protein